MTVVMRIDLVGAQAARPGARAQRVARLPRRFRRAAAAQAAASVRHPVLGACSVAGRGEIATGWLSDHLGHKPLIAMGMLVRAGALALLATVGSDSAPRRARPPCPAWGPPWSTHVARRGVGRGRPGAPGARGKRPPVLAGRWVRGARRARGRRRRRRRLRGAILLVAALTGGIGVCVAWTAPRGRACGRAPRGQSPSPQLTTRSRWIPMSGCSPSRSSAPPHLDAARPPGLDARDGRPRPARPARSRRRRGTSRCGPSRDPGPRSRRVGVVREGVRHDVRRPVPRRCRAAQAASRRRSGTSAAPG